MRLVGASGGEALRGRAGLPAAFPVAELLKVEVDETPPPLVLRGGFYHRLRIFLGRNFGKVFMTIDSELHPSEKSLTARLFAFTRRLSLTSRADGDSIRAVLAYRLKGLERHKVDTDADSDTFRSAPVCSWCGHSLAPYECERRGRVCDKCVRMLTEAGVPDEEIFGSEEDDESSSNTPADL